MKTPASNEGRGLAKLADPRLWLAVVSASAVLWLVWRTTQQELGPGPLSAVHAALPELAGAAGCARCHGAPEHGGATVAMRKACGECHQEIEAQLLAGGGFHGALSNGSDCAACHGEHLGASYTPLSEATFVRAGFASRADYDHAGLDFTLTGVHTTLPCARCHVFADAPPEAIAADPAASGRFLGARQACTACHEDVHRGAFGASCAECHGQERPFAEAPGFQHTDEFPLAGVHGGHTCATCHVEGTPHALASYDAANGPTAVRACADCHASPHGVAFVRAAGSSCASCHAAVTEGFVSGDRETTRAAHAASGFVLADAHAAVVCEACHAPSGSFAERHPGRDAGACAVCHADPHGGQFGDAALEPSFCSSCHSATDFEAVTFDAARHAALGFPLDGAHASAACTACHTGADVTRYRGTPRTCAGCHDDVHEGAFAAGAPADGAVAGVTDCARCHGTASFQGARDGFDHGRWTGIALEGAHAALACDVCHPPADAGAGSLGPSVLATMPDPARAAASCAPCHANPHGARFDGLEPVEGRVACARCHVPTSFRDVREGVFEHGRWTGFELVGAHRATECAACHGAGRGGARLGEVSARFPGPVDRCATCHTNPHGERYDVHAPELVAGRVGCARCHGETSFRAVEAFDHAWTGFTLRGEHAALACAACHAPLPPEATGRIRGAAAGTACADCHADPHGGQFVRDGRTDCARCHGEARPFSEPRFDHATSRFPLDDVHAPLACSECHKPTRTRDGRVLVRYRPLGTQCADCHGTTGGRGR